MSWQLRLPAHSCDFETDFKERRTLMSQLTQCCPKTTTDELVDIREVTVDKDLPKEERIAAFLHQIKNRPATCINVVLMSSKVCSL